MSHASVLVAVDVVNPSDRAEIEAAVAFQMAPYDENEEWFRDGSRWDWYVIGGRYTGRLSSYDPEQDQRNWETCAICGGSGVRHGGREEFGEQWYQACNGCNGCSGKGTRLSYQFVPFEGDIVQVKNLTPENRKACFAFLRSRHWHERERLGWFGVPTATECELKNPDDPDVLSRRCLTIGDEGARIVVWNEPWEIWEQEFAKRFINPLPLETVLVVVDYHV